MKTTQELLAHINSTAYLESDGLRFPVLIVGSREVYGRTDYRVKPVGGAGERWVSEARLALPTVEAKEEGRAA